MSFSNNISPNYTKLAAINMHNEFNKIIDDRVNLTGEYIFLNKNTNNNLDTNTKEILSYDISKSCDYVNEIYASFDTSTYQNTNIPSLINLFDSISLYKNNKCVQTITSSLLTILNKDIDTTEGNFYLKIPFFYEYYYNNSCDFQFDNTTDNDLLDLLKKGIFIDDVYQIKIQLNKVTSNVLKPNIFIKCHIFNKINRIRMEQISRTEQLKFFYWKTTSLKNNSIYLDNSSRLLVTARRKIDNELTSLKTIQMYCGGTELFNLDARFCRKKINETRYIYEISSLLVFYSTMTTLSIQFNNDINHIDYNIEIFSLTLPE